MMSRNTVIILGIPIDNVTMAQAIEKIFNLVEQYRRDNTTKQVATVNVDFLVNTLSWRLKKIRHPEILDILRSADLVTADGMPIVWTSLSTRRVDTPRRSTMLAGCAYLTPPGLPLGSNHLLRARSTSTSNQVSRAFTSRSSSAAQSRQVFSCVS